MPVKKKAAKKRSYNRKPRLIKPEPVEPEKDLEIELLATLCSVIDNWTPEQRRRNLTFITSKYSEYIQ